MPCTLIADTAVMVTCFRIDINPFFARRIPIFRSWFVIFIFTLLNFPEGTLFNRVNPLGANLVKGIGALDRYPYSGHRALMGMVKNEWQDTCVVCGTIL